MNKFNVVIVINKDKDKLLMCHRSTAPYHNLYNLVGSKVEHFETDEEAAYRELYEETNVSRKDINLVHLMNFEYIIMNTEIQVFYGILYNDVKLIEEKHKLYWIGLDNDFFDSNVFAGEGNIGHMLIQLHLMKVIK